jgi:hypothetical protein
MANFYNAVAVSAQPMNVNFSSPAFLVERVLNFAFQVDFTGSTITGTFKLQGSCDPTDNVPANSVNPKVTNWSDITGSAAAITAAGDFLWTVALPGYNYVRLVYTDTSGGTSNGVCSGRFNGKT